MKDEKHNNTIKMYNNKKYTSRCPCCEKLNNNYIPENHKALKLSEIKRLNFRKEERKKQESKQANNSSEQMQP